MNVSIQTLTSSFLINLAFRVLNESEFECLSIDHVAVTRNLTDD